MASGMERCSWGVEIYTTDPSLEMAPEVFLRGWGGGLTRLRLPPEDRWESWKHEQAFRRGEAAAYHFYREKGQYDMMCCQGGAHGHSDARWWWTCVLCLTRPCQAPSFLSTDLPRAYL